MRHFAPPTCVDSFMDGYVVLAEAEAVVFAVGEAVPVPVAAAVAVAVIWCHK